jgi:ubiquinone/menaquinone biosynthesis C-methylase UbiE
MDPIREEVLAFYTNGDEAGRLERGIGPLESARSRELIARYLPEAPAVVGDVGGGPGAYSVWLEEMGHRVMMVDAVPLHVEQARERARSARVASISIELGDARRLGWADGALDVVIIHGPLYHLLERGERLAALREAHRVLRARGVVLAFGVTRYASAVVGVARGWTWDEHYREMCRREISTGEHRTPATWPTLFTTAYFHHVAELADEIAEAGFAHERTFGVEGVAWLAPDFEQAWTDPARRAAILESARWTEDEPVMSPHIMGVGRKA